VHYELAIFKEGTEEPCATGRFVHVFVERSSNRSCAIPERIRTALNRLLP
jgi:acyl-CoA thioester hydrolase